MGEFRAAHGRAKDLGRLTASECPPVDELPAASGFGTAPQRDPKTGRFRKGNTVAAAKRVKTGPRGALVQLEQQGDEAARAALAFGRRYSAHRRSELSEAHGGISAAVGAMVESAGDLLASARYWHARSVAEGNADYARLSAQLTAGARQSERDAWAMAALEAQARPKNADATPWLQGETK